MKRVIFAAVRSIVILWMLIIVAWFATRPVEAAEIVRDRKVTYAFRKANVCPSTGKFTGACPGWVMDHLHSLRCGGPDTPENLWWQTTNEAKLKDRQEDECWRYFQGKKK